MKKAFSDLTEFQIATGARYCRRLEGEASC